MIRTVSLAMLVAMLSCLATSAPAQVTFKFKFPDGRKSTSVTKIKTAQTLTLAGRELTGSSEQTKTVTSAHGKRAADGTLSVKGTISALQAALTLPGGAELKFDSADPDADPPGTQFDVLLDIFKASAKSSWTLVLDKENRVVSIKGHAAAFAELPENLRGTLKAQLDPVYLKTVANDEMDRLPSQPVSPGDTWQRTNTLRLEAGQKLTFTTTYTYQGSVEQEGKSLEKIVSKTTQVDYSTDADSPLKVVASNLKVAASEGVILFDPALGQIVSERSKVQITGTLKLEIKDKEYPGKLDLTMESTVTLK